MNEITSGYLLNLLFDMALLGFGVLINLYMILEQASAVKGKRVYIGMLIRERPYKLQLMAAGAIVGYIMILRQVPNPSAELLIAIGYASNDMIDKLTSTAAVHLERRRSNSESGGPPV